MREPSDETPLSRNDYLHLPVHLPSLPTPTNATLSATGAFLQGFFVSVAFGPVGVGVILCLKAADGSPESERRAVRLGAGPGLLLWAFGVFVILAYVYRHGRGGT